MFGITIYKQESHDFDHCIYSMTLYDKYTNTLTQEQQEHDKTTLSTK